MSERLGAPIRPAEADQGGRARGPLALELVALRGKDVVGVRHLRDGGSASVGHGPDAIARLGVRDQRAIGEGPFTVAEARAGTYHVQVPARARARRHGRDGIPRLYVGPCRIELGDGERAVVVLGVLQIRAQVVPFDAQPARGRLVVAVASWMAVIAAVYAIALALSAAFAPPSLPRLDGGALRKLHERFLPAATGAEP